MITPEQGPIVVGVHGDQLVESHTTVQGAVEVLIRLSPAQRPKL